MRKVNVYNRKTVHVEQDGRVKIVRMGGQGAPSAVTGASYITRVAEGGLSNEFALDSLNAGLLATDGDGNLAIATASDVPNLPASKITSGVFDAARIPALDYAATIHTHSASDIIAGQLDADRLPDPLPDIVDNSPQMLSNSPVTGTVNSGDATTDAIIQNLRDRLLELETILATCGIVTLPVALSASAELDGDNLVVTITAGDGPFNITGTGPGLPLSGVAAGVHTLTGPGTWTGVTVTETTGDEESENLGDYILYGDMILSLLQDYSGVLWLESRDITPVADGTALTAWPNLYPIATNTTAPGAAGTRPTYRLNIFGTGGPGVRFDGSDDWMLTPNFTATQALTVIMVANQLAWADGRRFIDGDTVNQIVINQGAGPNVRIYAGSAFVAGNTTAPLLQNSIIVARFNGASSSLQIAGLTPTTGNPGANNVIDGLVIGGAGNQAAGFFANFDLALLAVFDAELTAAQVGQIVALIDDRYSFTYARYLVFDGDSLTAGTGSSGGNTYPAQLITLLGGATYLPSNNVAVAGQTMADMITDGAAQVDVLYRPELVFNICCAWGGTNDLVASVSAATTYSRIVTYCQARQAAGFRVVILTILPRTTGVGTFEADRQTVNANIRANWATFADALADVGTSTVIGEAGDNLNTTYYDTDGVHLNNTGYGVVAGIVAAAIATL